ncbi:acetyl/propionyl/methylcrotonyl-CoA carboxylase subunit alpha [Streptomyces sp. NPDC001480]|uniref:acetyl/propionyl/methylcrotonyl-CoA carboxylase subunit alpha n=1 Tax=Streptomyces sp. NPDC001480 TaxID=3364577 RepID=UPI0036A4FD66
MLKRILIANRGEIARRIARTCARLGVEYVCVYSDADAGADHLTGAFEKVRVGAAPAARSYLDIDALIDAALRSGCDAVHPGYGFLSENPRFAERVVEAGLTFVGPRPETIRAMGDKATARKLMAAAGVPVLPGSPEATESHAELAADARSIGYPLILKPAAGGGGKGMRVVTDESQLADAAAEAVRLGRAAFGDGRVLAERYVPSPRHIEVQVFGDTQGSVVHLYERDCSLQRRHQKIVEEAPAFGLDESVRTAMLSTAVRGARALGYVNAGTFEFILGPDGDFYFLEVNTRLQVEHPVTEEITGIDLVEWQLRVAAGEPLPVPQEEITSSGHAIECRVYAEDPAAGFRPAPGRAVYARWPDSVRVEAAFDTAGEASQHYDPLVAKLVAHGPDRAAALRRLDAALGSTTVLGLTTNVGYLTHLLGEPRVRAGRTHTHLVDGVSPADGHETADLAIACAASIAAMPAPETASPWWGRLGPLDRAALAPDAPLGRITVRCRGSRRQAAITARTGSVLAVRVGDRTVDVRITRQGPVWTGHAGGHRWSGTRVGADVELCIGGDRFTITDDVRSDRDAAASDNVLRASLPGVVVSLPHAEGDRVEAGETVVVIEAMKMEHRLTAPAPATIEKLGCALHAAVAAGQVLAVLLPEESSGPPPGQPVRPAPERSEHVR